MIVTRMTRGNEYILISDYGYEWYVDGKLVKTGLVENKEEDIKSLQELGFA
jgi:hypothetical protein